jgi:sugar phosphate isomerase/epimerase
LLRWEVGLSTGIGYRHPIDDVLPSVSRAGFRAIEVSTAPRHLDLEHPECWAELRRSLTTLGLHVASLHAPFGHDVAFTSPDASLREHALVRLTRAADALQALGGALYVIHPGDEDQRWIWEREKRLGFSVESLTKVWACCQERGLKLVVETPLPHLLGGQPEDFAWILERLPSSGTSVCLDTSHTSLGRSLYEYIDRFADRIRHIQASDNRGVTDDHLPPGDGVIDWDSVVAALERIRYEGFFMLEVAGDGDLGEHLERVVASVRRTLGCGWPPAPPPPAAAVR